MASSIHTNSTLEVDSKDVIKLMLQFLKENNLSESAKILQEESGVSLNTVTSIESFLLDIHNGKWDSVLSQLNSIQLPKEKLIIIYEQVFLELLELGEKDLAKELLKGNILYSLKADHPERYLKLEHFSKRPYFNAIEAYDIGSSKSQKRQEIADLLVSEVSVVPPSRLLSLIGQALRFQKSQGLLPNGVSYDLFRGGSRLNKKDTDEKYPRKQAGVIRFSAESHPETIVFSSDGLGLVTGSIDGFIEVWDFESCKLRKDLEYQAKDELMMHEEAILCSSFSKDGEYLVTGSQAGKVKVWKLSTGQCLRKFEQAHLKGVTSVTFSRDSTNLLTSSFDQTARIHGLKGGKTLKEFSGHSSFVNAAIYSKDSANILTASSDGTCRLWDVKTTDCLSVIRPGTVPGSVIREFTIHTIMLMPNNPDQVFVCNKSSNAYIMTIQGQIIKTFSSGKVSGGDFVCATVSPQGKWIYCVGEDSILYIFDVLGGQLEHILQLADREVIGICHHPTRNLLCSVTDIGELKLWKA